QPEPSRKAWGSSAASLPGLSPKPRLLHRATGARPACGAPPTGCWRRDGREEPEGRWTHGVTDISCLRSTGTTPEGWRAKGAADNAIRPVGSAGRDALRCPVSHQVSYTSS